MTHLQLVIKRHCIVVPLITAVIVTGLAFENRFRTIGHFHKKVHISLHERIVRVSIQIRFLIYPKTGFPVENLRNQIFQQVTVFLGYPVVFLFDDGFYADLGVVKISGGAEGRLSVNSRHIAPADSFTPITVPGGFIHVCGIHDNNGGVIHCGHFSFSSLFSSVSFSITSSARGNTS